MQPDPRGPSQKCVTTPRFTLLDKPPLCAATLCAPFRTPHIKRTGSAVDSGGLHGPWPRCGVRTRRCLAAMSTCTNERLVWPWSRDRHRDALVTARPRSGDRQAASSTRRCLVLSPTHLATFRRKLFLFSRTSSLVNPSLAVPTRLKLEPQIIVHFPRAGRGGRRRKMTARSTVC